MLQQRVYNLFDSEIEDWQLARDKYADLQKSVSKRFCFGDFHIDVTCNPARMRSTMAAIKQRLDTMRTLPNSLNCLPSEDRDKCFLCTDLRPKEQRYIEVGNFQILVNPYPIFPKHFTIAHKQHTPQVIVPYFDDFLYFAKNITDFAIFYNGANCGASAPFHAHFQAAAQKISGCLQSVWVSHVAANQYDDGFDDGTGFAHVWQNGSASENGECVDGDYPFIVDIPDIASFPATAVGTAQKIAVCAFAESAELFASEAAFAASQEAQEMKWAAQCFIPSGMFLSENAPEGARPAARALFTGIVCKAEKRRNTLTHSPFYYCEIATYGGIWSAVYPAEAFADTPQAGNVIQGEYWLTGRLADAPAPQTSAKQGFWQKLIGK